MGNIETYLKNIMSAVYGKDVRQSIHDGIKQCYYDGKVGATDLEARERASAAEARMDTFTSLKSGSTTGDAELIDCRVGFDGKKYSSAGAAIREQIRDTHVIEVSETEPTRDNTELWINPKEFDTFELPEVKDDEITGVDTWSSAKINNEIKYLGVSKITADHYTTEAVEYERVSGEFYNEDGEITADDAYEVVKVSVSEGDAFLIQSYYGYQAPAALVFNEGGTLIKCFDISTASMKRERYSKPYVMPFGASMFVINGRPATLSADVKKIIASSSVDKAAESGIKNLLDIVKSSKGVVGTECVTADNSTPQMLIRSDGIITSYASDKYIVAEIPIKPYELYRVNCRATFSNLAYVFYDISGNVIDSISGPGSSSAAIFDDYLIVPNNAARLVISTSNGTLSAKKITKITNDASPWESLKWTCVGDSLTEHNTRTTMNYHDYISQRTGIVVNNMGQSGSGFKRKYDSNNAYYQRIASVPTDSHVVTIMGSGNDSQFDVGSPTDTGTDTLCGCINTTIDNLYAILPTVQLGIITPTPWQTSPPNTDNKMKSYADAIVEICKLRGIPCLDLYRCSGLRPWDETFRTLAYSKDDGNGVHPDETGHKMIASRIEEFLRSLIDCYVVSDMEVSK